MIENLKEATVKDLTTELEMVTRTIEKERVIYDKHYDFVKECANSIAGLIKMSESITAELKSREYPKLVHSAKSGNVYLLESESESESEGTIMMRNRYTRVGEFINRMGIVDPVDYQEEIVLDNRTLNY